MAREVELLYFKFFSKTNILSTAACYLLDTSFITCKIM